MERLIFNVGVDIILFGQALLLFCIGWRESARHCLHFALGAVLWTAWEAAKVWHGRRAK